MEIWSIYSRGSMEYQPYSSFDLAFADLIELCVVNSSTYINDFHITKDVVNIGEYSLLRYDKFDTYYYFDKVELKIIKAKNNIIDRYYRARTDGYNYIKQGERFVIFKKDYSEFYISKEGQSVVRKLQDGEYYKNIQAIYNEIMKRLHDFNQK